MKCILAILFACVMQAASAQFAGKLTYKIVFPTSTLTMIYSQNGNSARVTAQSVANSDTTKVTNTQDTLLFDIQGRKTTHLAYRTGMAVIMPNMASLAQQAMANSKMQSTISIETVGPETVNGYACTHYIIVGTTGKLVSKRDVWVTTSLGTPGVQVVGGYLYYTPDFPQEVKLLAAGGAGVVVKSVINAPGLMTAMNLVAVDTKAPNPGLFTVPGWYRVVDNSQMTMPK